MKLQNALIAYALISGIALGLSNSAFAGYAVAGCSQTGVIGIVGNATQPLAILSDRAIAECEKQNGINCQIMCSGVAGGFVAIARGQKQRNAIGLGCAQQDTRVHAQAGAMTECSQVGGNNCKVIRTFEAK
jgi:hypothetical protein